MLDKMAVFDILIKNIFLESQAALGNTSQTRAALNVG